MEGETLKDPITIKQKAVEFFSNQFRAHPEFPAENLFQVQGPSVLEANNTLLILVQL